MRQNLHQRDVAVDDGSFTYDDGTQYHVIRRLNDDGVFLVEHPDGRREAKRESDMDRERPYLRQDGVLVAADYKTPAKDQRFGYRLEHGVTALTEVIVAIVCGALFFFAASWVIDHNEQENRNQYERGQYDGAHDLCQEVGGTWMTSEGGWCDMPGGS